MAAVQLSCGCRLRYFSVSAALASSLLSITDRIYVLFDGHVMAELETAKTGEDEIMHYSVGSTTKYA